MKPITIKILAALFILAGFGITIYFITKVSHGSGSGGGSGPDGGCPAGQMPNKGSCRPICQYDLDSHCGVDCTHWNDKKGKCEKCPVSSVWTGSECKVIDCSGRGYKGGDGSCVCTAPGDYPPLQPEGETVTPGWKDQYARLLLTGVRMMLLIS